MRLVFSPRARADLYDIWLWIAEQSGPDRADAVYDSLVQRCNLLAERPLAGRAAPEFGEDLRCFTFRPYIVVYRPRGKAVEVIRIVHGARDRATLMPPEPSEH
jgi:toxin ParE1/3/4